VISRLEDFAAKVTTSLDNLDRFGMQDIILETAVSDLLPTENRAFSMA
jgi:hypothetical protein